MVKIKPKIKANGDVKEQSTFSRVLFGDRKGMQSLHDNTRPQVEREVRKLSPNASKEDIERQTKHHMREVKLLSYLRGNDIMQSTPNGVKNGKYTEEALRNGRNARIARYSAGAIGSTGLMLAPRFISGGNVTTNNKGERDIAGIPFI